MGGAVGDGFIGRHSPAIGLWLAGENLHVAHARSQHFNDIHYLDHVCSIAHALSINFTDISINHDPLSAIKARTENFPQWRSVEL